MAAAVGVFTEAMIENLYDLFGVENRGLAASLVRRITVSDAVVDDDSMVVALPTRLIEQLGLRKTGSWHIVRGGPDQETFDPVRLTIQGRCCTTDAVEVLGDSPVVIGRLPLMSLDLVIDPESKNLIGNPAHGGEQMHELY